MPNRMPLRREMPAVQQHTPELTEIERIERWRADELVRVGYDAEQAMALAVRHDIDLKRSFLIGDRWRDIDCAHAAGCRAVFIDHGYHEALREKPEFVAATFQEAVRLILQASAQQ